MTPPRTGIERLRHPRRDEHRTHRHVTRRQTLCRGHHVGLQIETSGREPLTTDPAETGHDLVDDKEDVVLAADVTHLGQVPLRRKIHTPRTDDRPREDSRDLVRTDILATLAQALTIIPPEKRKPPGQGKMQYISVNP